MWAVSETCSYLYSTSLCVCLVTNMEVTPNDKDVNIHNRLTWELTSKQLSDLPDQLAAKRRAVLSPDYCASFSTHGHGFNLQSNAKSNPVMNCRTCLNVQYGQTALGRLLPRTCLPVWSYSCLCKLLAVKYWLLRIQDESGVNNLMRAMEGRGRLQSDENHKQTEISAYEKRQIYDTPMEIE